jgi:hypothetical protein
MQYLTKYVSGSALRSPTDARRALLKTRRESADER